MWQGVDTVWLRSQYIKVTQTTGLNFYHCFVCFKPIPFLKHIVKVIPLKGMKTGTFSSKKKKKKINWRFVTELTVTVGDETTWPNDSIRLRFKGLATIFVHCWSYMWLTKKRNSHKLTKTLNCQWKAPNVCASSAVEGEDELLRQHQNVHPKTWQHWQRTKRWARLLSCIAATSSKWI